MEKDLFHEKVSKEYCQFDFPLSKKESDKFLKKLQNHNEVLNFRFLPVLQFDIIFKKNPNGGERKIKKRPISLVGHHDSGVYSFFSEKLNSSYNKYVDNFNINKLSVAYRNVGHISNLTVANEVFRLIDTHDSWVFKGDFKGFFDNLNHKILFKNLYEVLKHEDEQFDFKMWNKILKSVTEYSYIKREKFLNSYRNDGMKLQKRNGVISYFKTRKEFGTFIKKHSSLLQKNKKVGIPQGTPISGILANIYMVEFDKNIENLLNVHKGMYRRYSDDFIIVIPKEKMDRDNFLTLTSKIINMSAETVNLEIEDHKTDKLDITGNIVKKMNGKETSLDYLGFSLYHNTVSIRPKSIYKFRYKGRRSIRASFSAEETYEYLLQLKKSQATNLLEWDKEDLWKTIRTRQKRTLIFSKNINKQRADQNRVWNIAKRVEKNIGVPEVKKSKKQYLLDISQVRPRESFLSYVKKANEVFSKKNNEGALPKFQVTFTHQVTTVKKHFLNRGR